jgi:hypothetical protein
VFIGNFLIVVRYFVDRYHIILSLRRQGGQFKPGKGIIHGYTYAGRMEDTVHITLSEKSMS